LPNLATLSKNTVHLSGWALETGYPVALAFSVPHGPVALPKRLRPVCRLPMK
jgi:hypothetical protein